MYSVVKKEVLLNNIIVDDIIKTHLYAFYKQASLKTFIVKCETPDILFKINSDFDYNLNKLLINGIENDQEICFYINPFGHFLGIGFNKKHRDNTVDILMIEINLQTKKFNIETDKIIAGLNPSEVFAAIYYIISKTKV